MNAKEFQGETAFLEKVSESVKREMSEGVRFWERRPGILQMIVPLFHEDGDMLDIYVAESPKGDEFVRVCDFGMTLMRVDDLSPETERTLRSVLINGGVERGDDGLHLDAPVESAYKGALQFASCVQRICAMKYWAAAGESE